MPIVGNRCATPVGVETQEVKRLRAILAIHPLFSTAFRFILKLCYHKKVNQSPGDREVPFALETATASC